MNARYYVRIYADQGIRDQLWTPRVARKPQWQIMVSHVDWTEDGPDEGGGGSIGCDSLKSVVQELITLRRVIHHSDTVRIIAMHMTGAQQESFQNFLIAANLADAWTFDNDHNLVCRV